MSQGKFSGFAWHNEYHSAREKDYDDICIYLHFNRECKNKKSPLFLSKCFQATICPYRVKPTQVDNKADDKVTNIIKKENDKIIPTYFKLLRCSDNAVVEIFTNGKNKSELPPLHIVCLDKYVGNEFSYSNSSYKVIEKHYNKTSPNMYNIIRADDIQKKQPSKSTKQIISKEIQKKTINKVETKQTVEEIKHFEPDKIKLGDKITLYSESDNDIYEFEIGENYNVGLEKFCIGKMQNDIFVYNSEKYYIDYVEHWKRKELPIEIENEYIQYRLALKRLREEGGLFKNFIDSILTDSNEQKRKDELLINALWLSMSKLLKHFFTKSREFKNTFTFYNISQIIDLANVFYKGNIYTQSVNLFTKFETKDYCNEMNQLYKTLSLGLDYIEKNLNLYLSDLKSKYTNCRNIEYIKWW